MDWLVTHALATSGLPLERLGLVRRVQARQHLVALVRCLKEEVGLHPGKSLLVLESFLGGSLLESFLGGGLLYSFPDILTPAGLTRISRNVAREKITQYFLFSTNLR